MNNFRKEAAVKKLIILLALLVVILGFRNDVSAGGQCFAVQGEIDQDLSSPPGTISGDIEGSIYVEAGAIEWRGPVMFRPLTQHWEITGGIIPELHGETLVLEGDFLGTLANPPLLSINNTLRVAEGAQMANITEHGWTNVVTLLNHLEYHGVICP